MFLGILAFIAAGQERFWQAAILAGLASLTRNQGVLLAVSIGFASALWPVGLHYKQRIYRFVASGVVSGVFYLSWLFFIYRLTGDPFASAAAQEKWGIAKSLPEYVSNLLWLSPNNAFRALWFWLNVFTSGYVYRKYGPRALPISIYLLSSVLLWPLQGNNFPQAYRFGVVLFPFWLQLGSWLQAFVASHSLQRKWVGGLCYSSFIALSGWVGSYYYLQTQWPY